MLGLFTLQSIAAPFAIAQENPAGIRLSTSPLPINLRTTPGKTISTEIRIRNSGSQPETLQAGLLKFDADETTGNPTLQDREDGDDYFDWVSFSPSRLNLAPNEWGTTTMTIKVPSSAAFGYYYAATFGRADEVQAAGESTSLQGAAATLVLLDVDVPGAKREVEIESLTTDKKWYEFLPATFKVRLRNTGNVHVAPFGTLFIEQNGQAIDSLPFNQAKGNILPQSPRTYTTDWSRGFPVYAAKQNNGQNVLDEQGQTLQELTWDFSKANTLRMGKYTANLVLAYDNGERDVPLKQSLDFWVIPWRILLGGLAIVLFTAAGVFMIGKSIWRRATEDRGDY